MALTGWSDTVYVEHGSAAALDDMTVGSLAFWCFTTSNTARQVMMGKSLNLRLELAEQDTPSTLNWGKTRATTANAISASLANFSSYAINKWLFVVVNFDTVTSGNNTLWIGDLSTLATEPSSYTLQDAGSGAITSDAASNWRVGRHGGLTGRQFVGRIATHWVFNKVLTPNEIASLQWTGRIGDMGANLLYSEYGFAGATATQPDWSGNGNAGTVTGTPTIADHVPRRPIFGVDRGWMGNFTAAAGGGGSSILRQMLLQG